MFEDGMPVSIEGGIPAVVVETRGLQVRCQLADGRAVWVPADQLSQRTGGPAIDLSARSPSAGPGATESRPSPTSAPGWSQGPAQTQGSLPSQNPYAAPGTPTTSAIHPTRSNFGLSNPRWLLFSLEGRACRSQYWSGVALLVLAYFAGILLIGTLAVFVRQGETSSEALGLLVLLFAVPIYLVVVWASIALSVKRWHDRDKSGWWWFISFIPVIGGIWHFVEVGCLRGTFGPNQYGDDPTPP